MNLSNLLSNIIFCILYIYIYIVFIKLLVKLVYPRCGRIRRKLQAGGAAGRLRVTVVESKSISNMFISSRTNKSVHEIILLYLC